MPLFGLETFKNLVFFSPFWLCCSKYWHFLQIPHLPLLQVVQNIDIFCKCFFWLSCNLRWGRITPGCGRFSPNTRTAGCLQFVAFLCKSPVINAGSFSLPSWHSLFLSRPRTVLVVAVPHGEKADLDQVREELPFPNIINTHCIANTNFLSDPGPIIVYPSQWLTNSLTHWVTTLLKI